MASMYDVDPSELIEKVAEKLKTIKEINPPSWASFVKTGVSRERPPVRKDWWYLRTASILRIVYRLGPIGVSKLRTKYGGKKNRGVRPEHFYKGSGSIIRKSLQQLEKAELVKKVEKGVRKGKIIAPKGKSLLDKTATEILGKAKEKDIKPKKEKEVKEKPKTTEEKVAKMVKNTHEHASGKDKEKSAEKLVENAKKGKNG